MRDEPGATTSAGRVADVLASAAVGVQQLGLAIALALLVFAGPLAPGAPRAMTSIILGGGIVALAVGLRTSMPVAGAGAQDTSAIILAAIGTSVATTPGLDADTAVATMFVAVALASLVAGVSFLVLARRGWTNLVRYLPWPVVTGFTAGTGWLLARGGLSVMWRAPFGFGDLADLGDWALAKFLVPGVALGIIVVLTLLSRLSNLFVSITILISIAVFHLVGRAISTPEQIEEAGWLVGPFPADSQWSPIGPSDLAATDWSVLFGQTLPIVAMVIVSLISLLLNLSGLEPLLGTEIDLDREVTTVGLANLGVGVVGGLPGWHLLGDTTLAWRLGARTRTLPIVIALMAGALVVVGIDIVGQLPRMVAGGVLVGLGLQILIGWARQAMPLLSVTDQAISAGILAAIAVFGVLPGVALGVLTAATLFVVSYSRTSPTRFVIAAAGRSNVDRSWHERELLISVEDAVMAVGLQGFLFFGSITRLQAEVEARLMSANAHFVVLDFSRVSGLDSTAASGLGRLIGRLEAAQVVVMVSGVDESIANEFDRNEVPAVERHPDLDHAMAACEDRVLAESHTGTAPPAAIGPRISDALADRLTRRELTPGERLIEAGGVDRTLFFVESGRLTAWVTLPDGSHTRLRQIRTGSWLGEVSFCNGGPRTADVIADTDVAVLALTRERFDRLADEQPELALEVQNLLLSTFADRLSATSAMIRHLLN